MKNRPVNKELLKEYGFEPHASAEMQKNGVSLKYMGNEVGGDKFEYGYFVTLHVQQKVAPVKMVKNLKELKFIYKYFIGKVLSKKDKNTQKSF